MIWFKVMVLLLLLVSTGVNVMAWGCAWKFIKRNRLGSSKSVARPPVSILVPVCGVEEEGLEHFKRFTLLNWSEYQLIFTVLDPSDPAVPLLQELVSSSTCKVEVQVGGPSVGVNLKVRNLLNAIPRVQHEWMVICDADIKPKQDFLEGLLSPLTQSQTGKEIGLVHCLYRCEEDRTLAAAWENVWINCDFWVQALLGDRLRGTNFAFGAAMAFHRSTLNELGGLEVLSDYLADDYQIGNRVAALGKRVVFNEQFVTLQSKPQGWRETWRHLLRWSRTIRVCQFSGHAGSFLTNMTFFSVMALLWDPVFFLWISMGTILLRILMANQCRNWILNRKGVWSRCWLIPFKDLTQAALWLLAFRNGTIEWRGVKYTLLSDGKLIRKI